MIRHVEASDGVRIAYQDIGEGDDTLVMVQGLGMPGSMWQALAEDLAETSGFRVILPDNRGVGHSDLPLPPYNLPRMADDVAEVMTAAGVRRAYVSGVSLGGMISQHLALRHHERLQGLVLIATTCGLPHGRFPTPSAIRLLLKMTLGKKNKSGNIDDLRQLLAHPNTAERMPEFISRMQEVQGATPTRRRAFAGQLLAATRHNVGGRLHRIKVPTEVVVGEADFLIPPENSHILAERIPNAKLTVLDNAGHILPFERPEALLEAITRVRERSKIVERQ